MALRANRAREGMQMVRVKGVAASGGTAMGAAHFLGGKVEVRLRAIGVEEIESETRRLADALARSDAQLARIQAQLAAQEGDDHQYRILEAHRLMLTDVHMVEATRKLIRDDRVSAEWAVHQAMGRMQAVFARIEDPYFRDRGSDIDMVGEQILRNLVGMEASAHEQVPSGAVVFAHDLSPADVTQLARVGVSGFFTEGGGKTSHTAIVARALGLPLVVGVSDFVRHVHPGMTVIVDGTRGEVVLDPDDDARARSVARRARDQARDAGLAAARLRPAETLDGVRIHLAANVELLEEVPVAVELGAESIGLFRTEFLYLERADLPSEDEQVAHAVLAIKSLAGLPATFRTLDLGGDKMPHAVRMPVGPNPALGLRSIRYSLHRHDIFKVQLRALYRAAATGPLRIMLPLISGVAELRAVREICRSVCADLALQGVAHNPAAPVGVMIETPSAAVIADLLAEECDFLSIGTNDLIQYTMAADRQDEHVGYLYHPLHPAILRLLQLIVQGAARAGKPVAMCGDMAGDPALTWVLLGLGLRDFSMAPRQVPVVKAIVRATRMQDALDLCADILSLHTEFEIEDRVYAQMNRKFPVELGDPDEDRVGDA